MLLRRFLVVLAVVVGMCVVLVGLHGKKVSVSYRLSRLTAEKAELLTEKARLASLVSRLQTPHALAQGVARYDLELVPRGQARAHEGFRLTSRVYDSRDTQ